jgi:hypothetical protein
MMRYGNAQARSEANEGVTDREKSKQDSHSRNAKPDGNVICSGCYLGGTTPPAASFCIACGDFFRPGEPVWRDVTCIGSRHCNLCMLGEPGDEGYGANRDDLMEEFRESSCGCCKRPIFYDPKVCTHRGRLLCTKRCENAYYRGGWRNRWGETPGRPNFQVCQNCNETFTPKRSDAKQCSSACKQKAYRQRQRQKILRAAAA